MTRYFYIVNPWWENKRFDIGTIRPSYVNNLEKDFNKKPIHILTGLRRVGKSTIVLQLINSLL